MRLGTIKAISVVLSLTTLASCGSGSNLNPFAGGITLGGREARADARTVPNSPEARQSTLGDLFTSQDANVTIEVNKYIWNASLDILNFLPLQAADPFSGVIVTGFGTPPGGGRAYRATIYITDPALDARSLNVALATRGGPASIETQRAVEDAILARARQLRIADRGI